MPNQHSPHQKGISKMNYTSIQLVREGEQPKGKIEGPDEAIKFLDDLYSAAVEKLIVIALDSRCRINAIQVVSIGTLNASLAHPREVFQVPLLTASSSIIVAHNHPSGDPEPSAADKKLTNKLVAAGRLLGIKVADHIVVGERGKFTSMKLEGDI